MGDLMERNVKRSPSPAGQPAPDLRTYLATLWRRKAYILAVLGVVVPTALFYSFQQVPLYESTSEVLVRPVNLDPTQPGTTGAFVNLLTEERIASSSAVAGIASDRLGGSIRATIDVTPVEGTQSLLFEAVSRSPEDAQRTAQAFADAYLEFRRQEVLADLEIASRPIQERLDEINQQVEDVQRRLLEENLSEADRGALLSQFSSLLAQRGSLEERLNDLVLPENINVGDVLQDAPFPFGPFSPDHARTLTFAVFVGLSLGVGIAFLRDRLDVRVRGKDDLEERVGVPTLGVIPRDPQFTHDSPTLLTFLDPDSPASEAFRVLGTRLVMSASELGAKSIMVTSATEGEGKTLTVANLGVTLARAGKRVVLVSADLQRAELEEYFAVEPGAGLTDVLTGKSPLQEAMWAGSVENLHVLRRGPAPMSKDPVMNPESISKVLATFQQHADFILIDSAPLLGMSDPIALAIAADAILVVADARRSDQSALNEVRLLLERIGTPIIGSVLTNSDHSVAPYYVIRYRADQPLA
jgi:capsular exopolysaccharide synthesis family protein